MLTLDQALQWNTEQALIQGVTAANAKGGTAIVVDVQTGDVLAMATVDGATDTHPVQVASANESDRPVSDIYEPGSTNKVITMSGAIQEGLVSPDTVLDNIGQSVEFGGTEYEDVDDHPSSMSVTDILAQSSNVGTIRVAGMLGKQRFASYLDAFGLGKLTGVGLPGEIAGHHPAGRGLQRHEHGVDPDRLQRRCHRAADARRLQHHRQQRDGAAAPHRGGDGRQRRQSATTRRSRRPAPWSRPAPRRR